MAVLTTGVLPKFLKKVLWKAWDGAHRSYEPQWSAVFNKETSTDQYEEISAVTGLLK